VDGIGLAAFTAPTMLLLARAKRKVGDQLNSSATVGEASQNMLCAYLSVALLVGLLLNAPGPVGAGPLPPPERGASRSSR